MRVVATAGHVDHGKSTLVRALTGTDPDRLAEEKRRGLTIELGFAGFTLPGGERLAFVDVPGHRRFIGNMLAGLGPAPAVLFVVAADQGWQPQSTEHLDAVDALGVTDGLLVLTRCGLAAEDQLAATRADALARLATTSLGGSRVVETDAVSGAGLDELRSALDELVSDMPSPETTAPVRFWIDRSFSMRGTGTVVTGTLAAGTLAVGDVLTVPGGSATIRSLEVLGEHRQSVGPVSRVAVALRGLSPGQAPRGAALLTPDAYLEVWSLDVRRDTGTSWRGCAPQVSVHVGTASVTARVRPFDEDTARLHLAEPLPLRLGDRLIVRDDSASRIHCGATVLDLDPAGLTRRGDAARRAQALHGRRARDAWAIVSDRGAVRTAWLAAAGAGEVSETVGSVDGRIVGDWAVSADQLKRWENALRRLVSADALDALSPGIPIVAAAGQIRAPVDVVRSLVSDVAARVVEGHIRSSERPTGLGAAQAAIDQIRSQLQDSPFRSPEARELDRLGLGARQLATAAKRGLILRLPDEIVLLPDAPARAMRILAGLEQPFTTSAAREALGTTRRVVIPLLEHLDARGWTRRLDGALREVVR